MANGEPEIAQLTSGLHDQLVSRRLDWALKNLDPRLRPFFGEPDVSDSHLATAQYLEVVIASALSTLRGEDAREKQRAVANRIIGALHAELGADWVDSMSLSSPLRRLLAIHLDSASLARHPDTPLSRSALITGSRHDPNLASQLQKEITTADRVDILCSFIRWSGLRILLPQLKELTAGAPGAAPRLRVITTSYMGATDPRAIEELRALPNTEVRISYDTARTRLHAKAYLIHRESGFGSAYVGSANLSHAALSEGLEWTNKISQYELPYLWQRVGATFDGYWNDPEFEPYGKDSFDRLASAINRERIRDGRAANPAEWDSRDQPFFELRPYPFQEEILDTLAAERDVQQKHSHLVVAATGTGKTIIAAFDYKQWCATSAASKTMLFVAHREEILRQARGTFRAVLRDANFGDLLVGGAGPTQTKHLFCSIQSYNSRQLSSFPPEHFEYVVVDEFHHAAAASYQRLLDHVKPEVLLGLTATPERADLQDVLGRFGGEASASIRLPDAIHRRLLCPFQYFGVSDIEDLASLRWQRGGYATEDLNRIFTGNDARAGLILDKIREYIGTPRAMRALGFCASVAHAEFMAAFMNAHEMPAVALSAQSSPEERKHVQDRLRRRDINIIFVVDLYNEGVDIPEVDTILFLRPTESLTIFLQQLGRGLRLHESKDFLTVLDFIGHQRREFRFAPQFRAMCSSPGVSIEEEIAAGCPSLPAGCSIQLERIAQEHVLENVRASVNLRRPRMVSDLRTFASHHDRAPTFSEAITLFGGDVHALLKGALWSRLLQEAGLRAQFAEPDEDAISNGLRRLTHVDDPIQLDCLIEYLRGGPHSTMLQHTHRVSLLHSTLWGDSGKGQTLEALDARLRNNPVGTTDIVALLEHNRTHTQVRARSTLPSAWGSLVPHARYTQGEILTSLGFWTLEHRPTVQQGVLYLQQRKLDVFFITLSKNAALYSPTTMYEDYVINEHLFHWQSQNQTGESSPTGQRYINHRALGVTPLLFVRERPVIEGARTAPYAFLGPASYVSHTGSKPMSIIWRLDYPMPVRLARPAEA